MTDLTPVDRAPAHEVMRALTEHAKTLGWEISACNWKATIGDESEYEVWLHPAERCANCAGTGMDSTLVATDPYAIYMPHPCGYCEVPVNDTEDAQS